VGGAKILGHRDYLSRTTFLIQLNYPILHYCLINRLLSGRGVAFENIAEDLGCQRNERVSVLKPFIL
jgi:hypothetical protein